MRSVPRQRAKWGQLRAGTKGDIAELRAEVKDDINELRTDIKHLEQKMDSQYASLLNALTIDKRLTLLKQAQQQASNPKLA